MVRHLRGAVNLVRVTKFALYMHIHFQSKIYYYLVEKSALLEVFAFVNITNQNACDDYPMFVDSCVWAYTVANCPESHALQSAECWEKTEWVNKCLFKE